MPKSGFIKTLLFPARCGYCNAVQGFAPVCPRCGALVPGITREDVPLVREGNDLGALEAAYACFDYAPPVHQAIHAMKKAAGAPQQRFYAKLAAQRLFALQESGALPVFDCLLAPPPTKRTIKENGGYHHSRTWQQLMQAETGIPVGDGLLEKAFETVPQKHLNGRLRRCNLLGAYTLCENADVRGKTILLTDDVLTTGATLNECAKMLLYGGAESVYALCIATADGEKPPEKPVKVHRIFPRYFARKAHYDYPKSEL